MIEMARGTRYLQSANEASLSPYGDGWSVLNIGHHGIWNNLQADQQYWVSNNDPTVVMSSNRSWVRAPNLSPQALSNDRGRLVFRVHSFTGIGTYAVSLKGAARIIYDQAILPRAGSFDTALSQICKGKSYAKAYGDIICIGVFPTMTGIHRPAGDMARDSDRQPDQTLVEDSNGHLTPQTIGDTKLVRDVAMSENLMFPVRLNLGILLTRSTEVLAQFPTSALRRKVELRKIEIPRGGPACVKSTEYVLDK